MCEQAYKHQAGGACKKIVARGSSSPKRCSKPQQPQHQQPVIMVKNGLSFLQNNLSLVKISPPGSPGESRGPQGLVVALESSGPESANYRSPTAQSQLRPQLYVRSQSSQQFPRSLHEPTVRVQQLPPNFSRTASCSTISPEALSSPVHQRIRPKNPKFAETMPQETVELGPRRVRDERSPPVRTRWWSTAWESDGPEKGEGVIWEPETTPNVPGSSPVLWHRETGQMEGVVFAECEDEVTSRTQQFIMVSSMYCQLLVVICVGFYMYMYSVSLLFLLYVYIYLLRRSNNNGPGAYRSPKKIILENLRRISDKAQGPPKGLDGDGPLPPRLKKQRISENDRSHGSLFLRIGAIAFGLGTMVYNGLEFGSFFEIPSTSPCYSVLLGINPVLQMAFTFAQMYFIFMNAR
ncbi:hypothetical protein HPB47_011382, partial [Ixodes persulcatus]